MMRLPPRLIVVAVGWIAWITGPASASELAFHISNGQTHTYAISIEVVAADSRNYITGIVTTRVTQQDGDVAVMAAAESLHEVDDLSSVKTDALLRGLGYGKYLPQEFSVHEKQGAVVQTLSSAHSLPCELGSLATWLFPQLPTLTKEDEHRSRFKPTHRFKLARNTTTGSRLTGSGAAEFKLYGGLIIQQQFVGQCATSADLTDAAKVTIRINQVPDQAAKPFEEALDNLITHGETRVAKDHWTDRVASLRPSGKRVTADTKLVTGLEVMANYRGGWYGARVKKLLPDGYVEVKFSHYNKTEIVTLTRDQLQLHSRTDLSSEHRESAIRNLKSGERVRIEAGLRFLRNKAPKPDDQLTIALVHALSFEEPRVRRSVISTMSKWATPKCVPVLVKLLEIDRETRTTTMSALYTFGTAVEPHVVRLLRSPNEDVRRDAVSILGRVGTKRCIPFLKKMPEASDWHTNALAKSTIRRLQSK